MSADAGGRPPLRGFAEIEREATEAKVAQVVAGVERGMTFRDIAAACGTSPATISRTAREGGVTFRAARGLA